jgi:hypothetical protein
LKEKLTWILKFSRDWLQYDFWISFFDESYLFLMVCAGLNMRYYLKWQEGGDAANSLLSLLFGFVLVIFPFFVAIFYNLEKNYERIWKDDEGFRARCGSILNGLRFKKKYRWSLVYPCM